MHVNCVIVENGIPTEYKPHYVKIYMPLEISEDDVTIYLVSLW